MPFLPNCQLELYQFQEKQGVFSMALVDITQVTIKTSITTDEYQLYFQE